MARLGTWLLVALVACGLAFIVMTAGALPPRVATHFGGGGGANGWMPREGYAWFALGFQLLLPAGLYFGIGWMPARFDRFTNLPHRDYWLAPARRASTLRWLRGFGAGMACAGSLLATGVHMAILDANARTPPRLDEPAFIAGMVAFVAVVIGSVIVMNVRFRSVPQRR
jgi:hypothetical protein